MVYSRKCPKHDSNPVNDPMTFWSIHYFHLKAVGLYFAFWTVQQYDGPSWARASEPPWISWKSDRYFCIMSLTAHHTEHTPRLKSILGGFPPSVGAQECPRMSEILPSTTATCLIWLGPEGNIICISSPQPVCEYWMNVINKSSHG